ncbi:MAG TPA: peptidylprolyl isomerase [Mycobacteriales bacterium]|nr:peptidylprolyl isomerase [Mycobacteriales bacterium]
MSSRLGTGGLLAAGVLAGAALLSGCQTNPGAAAVVGGSAISDDSLSTTVTAALANSQFSSQVGGRPAANRVELSRIITQKIIDELAAKYGVNVSAGDIEQQTVQLSAQVHQQAQTDLRTFYAAGGIPAGQLASVLRSITLEGAIGNKLVAAVPVDPSKIAALYQQNIGQYVQAHVAHILVASRALADRILAEVKADPAKFAALAAQYSTDAADAKKGGDLGTASPSSYVAPFAAAVETAPVGSFVEVHSQFGWHVIHVIARTVSQTLAQATPALKGQLLANNRTQLFQTALVAEGASLRISVNPRYGTWNNARLNVDPPVPTTSTPSATPS